MLYLKCTNQLLIMNHIKYAVTKDVLASKEIRFANYIIDFIVKYALSFGVGILIGLFSELTGNYTFLDILLDEDTGWIFEYVLGFLIVIVYYTTFETLTGRSLAKYITKTKVVLYDGSKPTINEILIRSLSRIIPFEALSFLGENGKGWHDSISKTYVVSVDKFQAKKETIDGLEEIGRIGE